MESWSVFESEKVRRSGGRFGAGSCTSFYYGLDSRKISDERSSLRKFEVKLEIRELKFGWECEKVFEWLGATNSAISPATGFNDESIERLTFGFRGRRQQLR